MYVIASHAVVVSLFRSLWQFDEQNMTRCINWLKKLGTESVREWYGIFTVLLNKDFTTTYFFLKSSHPLTYLLVTWIMCVLVNLICSTGAVLMWSSLFCLCGEEYAFLLSYSKLYLEFIFKYIRTVVPCFTLRNPEVA